MKVTVREIAREAGVSPATVSRVLNGLPGIGDETRRRICAILERPPPSSRAPAKTANRKTSPS